MIVTVPAFKTMDIAERVRVELVVVCASKSSDAVEFCFEPGRSVASGDAAPTPRRIVLCSFSISLDSTSRRLVVSVRVATRPTSSVYLHSQTVLS